MGQHPPLTPGFSTPCPPDVYRRLEDELAQSTLRDRLLLDQLPAIVWTVDCDLRITSSTGAGLRALGRSADKLATLNTKGAEVLTGDAIDAAFLTNAFGGADAVYTLFPPDPQSPDDRNKRDQEGAIARAIPGERRPSHRLPE